MQLDILGPLRARLDGRPVDLGPPKQRLLLAVLVARSGHAVSAGGLVDAVWGPAPPASAAENVYLYVHRLRKALGAARITGRGRQGYALVLGTDELDADRFAGLAAEGREALATGDPGRASRRLAEALSLWRDQPFADLADEPALATERARLVEARLTTVECRVEADLALGQHAELVAELTELTAAHPYRERLRGYLMLALYRCGRQADALAVYRHTRQVLGEELGLEPGPELRELERAILVNAPALSLDTVSTTPPRSAPTPGATTQVPGPPAGFTGRGGYLDQLDILVRDGGSGPVVVTTIAGMAGVGKTALALKWAHRARERFPDGQVYVDLRGHAGAPMPEIEALTLLLRALGTRPERIPVEPERARGLYRDVVTGRRILVLLDNAADAEQVRPLLPPTDGPLAVVTSRNRMTGMVASDGARRLSLDVLSPKESVALLTHTLGEGRVGREPDAVAALAEACGHLPLALRIAAAKLVDQPARDIADYVAALSLTSLAVPDDPQASVRNAFALSYRALDATGRHLFRVLGLHAGPHVTPEAAAALAGCAEPDVRPMLRTLESAYLLRHDRPGQYSMHDLLRSYARELALTDDGAARCGAAVRRLWEFYLSSVSAAGDILYRHTVRLPASAEGGMRFAADTEALAWLDAELPNLTAAVRQAADDADPFAWKLADQLRGYFWMRRHTADWLATGEAAREAAGSRGDALGLAAAHLSLGVAYRGLARYPLAVEHMTVSLTNSRTADWPEAEAAVLGGLAVVRAEQGHPDEALAHFTAALALNRRMNRLGGEATVLTNLSTLRQMLGDLRQSVTDALSGLRLFRATGNPGGEALMLTNLGFDYFYLGRFDQAREHLRDGLALHERVGDRYGVAMALCGRSQLDGETGRHAESLEGAALALATAREIGDRRCEAHALVILASVHQRLGDHEYALRLCTEALQVTREAGHEHAGLEALLGTAGAHRRLGRFDEALRATAEVLRVARQRRYRMLEGQALTATAAIRLATGECERAVALAESALANHRDTGHRLGEAHTELLLGHGAAKLDGAETARAHWRRALSIFTELGTPEAHEVTALLDQRWETT